jgi:hypothetical protein
MYRLGGVTMKKKVITGALVLVILGASQTTGYATYKSFPNYNYSINVDQQTLEINSPKGDIIVQDNLLISVRVLNDSSVTLSIYKENEDNSEESLIFGPERVDQGENLKVYTKELKDLSPGKYRMVFSVKDKLGNSKDSVIRYFSVKTKDEEMSRSLERIKSTNILENILEKIKK